MISTDRGQNRKIVFGKEADLSKGKGPMGVCTDRWTVH